MYGFVTQLFQESGKFFHISRFGPSEQLWTKGLDALQVYMDMTQTISQELILQLIIDEEIDRIGHKDFTRRAGSWFRPTYTRIKVTPAMARQELLYAVWAKCLSVLNQEQAEMLAAEKALAELQRRGVPRDRIQFRSNSFRLRLENGEYRIYKRGATEIVACPWPADSWQPVRLSGERFADFLQFFDAHVPEIDAAVPSILELIHERELEDKKQEMERSIKTATIRSLAEEFLLPLGISVSFQLKEDDRVAVMMTRTENGQMELPLEELADRLRDTASVLAALKSEPATILDADPGVISSTLIIK